MYAGHSIRLKDFLPRGMSEAEFYTMVVWAVAALCAVGIYFAFSPNRKMKMKIKAIQERSHALRSAMLGPKNRKTPQSSVNFIRAVVNKFQLLKSTQVAKMETQLMEAGLRSKDAIYIFSFFNMVLPIFFGVIGFTIMQINAPHVAPNHKIFNLLWPVVGMYLGLKLPMLYVANVRGKRYNNIQKALPDVLDLMTICAEAGLSLASMLDRVSRELGMAYPEMAEELALTSIEIGFLPDRNKALTNLATRCTLQEVRGITSVLIQTEKYGTPIAQALRVLSAEFRQARMLRAEQKAARLPALMTVPMIVFILPTLFIVILAPAIVKLMDNM